MPALPIHAHKYIATYTCYEYFCKDKDDNKNVVRDNTQDDGIIVLPYITQVESAKIKQTKDDKIAALKSSLHERQANRSKRVTKIEDSRLAVLRSIIHTKQAARMEYKKLESRAIVRPSTLALHPPITAKDQPVSVKKLELDANIPVSYTHLTLPTKRIV